MNKRITVITIIKVKLKEKKKEIKKLITIIMEAIILRIYKF